ncbi:MAG: rod shape-determining protein MreD [Anaerolineaceae bacterium]|nr:rod shape-determining protein MreD [Anaerolineaceae bacterium]
MGGFLSLPVLLVVVVIQATLIPQIAILGGRPDLVFLMVVAWSVHAPLNEGVTWAFMGGVLLDLLSAAPTGTSIPGMVLVVFIVNALQNQLYNLNLLLFLGIVGIGTVLQEIIVIVILSLTGFTVLFVESLGYVVLPTAAYNLAFALPVYWVARRIQRRFAERRQISQTNRVSVR